jgi:hypothetical protein
MWHCGVNPLTNEKIYTAKTAREKRLQRAMFFFRDPDYWPDVREALREANREDLIGHGSEFLVPPESKRERAQGAAQHYPGKAPPHLRDKRRDGKVNGIPAAAREGGDGWGTNSRDRKKPKRYEEDHGMPTGGAGCGGGTKGAKPVHAGNFKNAKQPERVLPDGEGGALEWMS